ncbi:hypothetical protein DL93DRAFT_2086507 [Clavulina sp. PMI_390]|nr:hypothetical protein DL93DRAFT_2086507 [Clavulina sp. PMI_390]
MRKAPPPQPIMLPESVSYPTYDTSPNGFSASPGILGTPASPPTSRKGIMGRFRRKTESGGAGVGYTNPYATDGEQGGWYNRRDGNSPTTPEMTSAAGDFVNITSSPRNARNANDKALPMPPPSASEEEGHGSGSAEGDYFSGAHGGGSHGGGVSAGGGAQGVSRKTSLYKKVKAGLGAKVTSR